MDVTEARWNAALKFLQTGEPGAGLAPRDMRLLALHIGKSPLSHNQAIGVLTLIGWRIKY